MSHGRREWSEAETEKLIGIYKQTVATTAGRIPWIDVSEALGAEANRSAEQCRDKVRNLMNIGRLDDPKANQNQNQNRNQNRNQNPRNVHPNNDGDGDGDGDGDRDGDGNDNNNSNNSNNRR